MRLDPRRYVADIRRTDAVVARCAAPLNQLRMPEAAYQVVVDHSCSLHERIADRRANELESAPRKFLAHGTGLRRLRWNLALGFPDIHLRLALYEPPDEFVKAAEFALNHTKGAGVLDSRGGWNG